MVAEPAPKIGGNWNKKYGVGRPRKPMPIEKIQKFMRATEAFLGQDVYDGYRDAIPLLLRAIDQLTESNANLKIKCHALELSREYWKKRAGK